MRRIFGLLIIYATSFNAYLESNNKENFIELIKNCLTGLIYQDTGIIYQNYEIYTNVFKLEDRENGLDWPQYAHTMIGLKRINNIQQCVEKILEDGIPGDFIETGVWRGGAIIFMKALLKANDITDRIVWAADSFEGLPVPNVQKYPDDRDLNLYVFNELKVSLEEVKNNFAKYGLLDDQVKFLKGWFKDTLPIAPIKKLALLRLDGDLYESTMDALVNLYPKLSVGGYVIVDDYGVSAPCARAVHIYREAHNINDEMHKIDASGAIYWRRTK